VFNSVAGIFRQEMNTLALDNPNILVMAATNYLNERVDASLVRSGRFDLKIKVDYPDESGRRQIFAKLIGALILRHETGDFRMFAADIDLGELAAATAGRTGADIAEVIRRVTFAKAVEAAEMRARGLATRPGPIAQRDLLAAIGQL
jgi:transitional endoplasmic reticulum ATPase